MGRRNCTAKTKALELKRPARKAAATGSLFDELVGFGYTYEFVSPAVVEEEAVGILQHSLDKYDVGNLAYFFPFELRLEKGLHGAVEKLARILAIEDRDASAINEIVVGAIVDQHNSFRGENRRRTGLDDA